MAHYLIGSTGASDVFAWRSPGRRARALTLFALGMISALSFLSWRDANPHVTVPSPVMPKPNAFDTFVRAGNLSSEMINGVRPLSFKNMPLRDERLIAARNKQALLVLREGFQFPYMNPAVRSFDTSIGYYAAFRSLARILVIDARVKAADGDIRGAAREDLDAVQMGVMIPRGAVLFGRLTGIACESIGRADLWREVGRLNPADAREVASRLEKLDYEIPPYRDTLQAEKWACQAGLMEIMQRTDWQRELADYAIDKSTAQRLMIRVRLLPYAERQLFGDFSRYMDRVIARSNLPYDRTRPAPAIPGDPVSHMLTPIFTYGDFKPTVDRTENSLLEGTLALRAYRLEHGHYPARLRELVPEILTRVPSDPFAAGQPLRYRRSDGACILYSVGPDGKDDGGVSSTSPAQTYWGRSSIQEDGRGDIVAGIDHD